jgi:outer membrane protein assembly factor BamB/tRNA A-37 threonylcarbamoyl transferase component Bud32
LSSKESADPFDSAGDARSLGDDATLLGDGESAPSSNTMLLEKGAKVGRYVVLERIGAGGMGVVFAAYDPELDRKVALKLLEPRESTGSIDSTPARAKLVREAQTLAKLSHPNVLGIFDAGVVHDAAGRARVFLATELVDGEDLVDWVKREQRSARFARGRSWRAVVERFVEAGRGLAAAHRAGIVHRDFKPHNVRIGDDGRVRVLDFGLARKHDLVEGLPQDTPALPEASSVPVPVPQVDAETVSTQWGSIAGTPAYMSPEQLRGQPIGPHSDQFSFCVALYEALYGHRPFSADNLGTLLYQTTQQEIRLPSGSNGVPRRIFRAVLRGLRADPEARHASMDELLTELQRDPWVALRAAVMVMSLCGLVGILAWSAWLYTRPGSVEVRVTADHGVPAYEVWIGEHRLEPTTGGARGEVSAGLHRVRVLARNHEPFEGVVEVGRGGVHELAVALRHETGMLDLEVEPRDATIRIDGVEYGSRLVDFALPTGEHTIGFTREGSHEAERTYRIEPGQTLRDFVYLPDAVAWSASETGINSDTRFIGDVTSDGLPELLHRNFNTVTVSDPWQGRPLWRVSLGSQHLELIGLGDVTGDGALDVVTTITTGDEVRIEAWPAHGDGTASNASIWVHRRPLDADTRRSPLVQRPLIVDVDGDGAADVVVGGLWGASTLSAYRGRDGRPLWEREVGGPIVGLAPLRGDATGPALVVVTPNRVAVLSLPDLRTRWSDDGPIHHDVEALIERRGRQAANEASPWPLIVGNAEHDGIVLISGQSAPDAQPDLRALAADSGQLLWTRAGPSLGASITPRPTRDGTATHVLVTVPELRGVYVLDAADGSVLFEASESRASWLRWPEDTAASLALRKQTSLEVWDPDRSVRELSIEIAEGFGSEPIVADWDGDGQPELLVADRTQRIRAYDRQGSFEGAIRLSADAEWIASVGDIDGDGFGDLLAQANGPVVLVGPKVRWSRRARDAVRAAPVAADFDGDGKVDVAAFGSFTKIDALHVFDGRTGRVEAVSEPAASIRRPVIVPRDDGGADILAQIMNGTSTMLFSGRDASTLHAFPFRQAYGTPGFGDLDGDGRPEVVALGWLAGSMPVIDTGSWLQAWSYDAPAGCWATPWIGDLNGDGTNELLTGFHDGSVALYRGRASTPVWTADMGLGKHDRAPAVLDLDGDGTMEVLVTRTSAPFDVVVLDGSTGRETRRFDALGGPASNVAFGDVDEDGVIDLFVGPVDGTIARIDAVGETRWSVRVPRGAWGEPGTAHGPMALADLDGDGRSELVVTTNHGRLLVLDATDGVLRWQFQGGGRFEGGPTLVDVDGDGVLEVLLGSADRRLLCLRTPIGPLSDEASADTPNRR